MAIAGVMICAVIWGTTWYAITWQLGTVEPIVSVVWRFGLAAVILFIVCMATRRPVRLNRRQHLAAVGQGAFVFALSYAFVYAAEGRINSAVVAVVFAALAFLNLVLFRFVARQAASRASWMGAGLGLIGVLVLSGAEIMGAELGRGALIGFGFALIAVMSSAVGNLFAWRGQVEGAPVLSQTAWAMAYGTLMLVVFGVATGVHWSLDVSAGYLLSLLYLSVFGSVIAFAIYFWVARARGYALASYISALTPPIAILVSVVFEHARFGWPAVVGLLLVIAGQVLMIRAPKVSAA